MARSKYKWGAKHYLSSFEIGETREHTDEFRWDTLRCMASKFKAEYNCRFTFYTSQGKRFIKRIE